ncbi:MAG: ribonuclease Z [Candidatus Heimdallarchaeota archaeon]
MSRLRLVFLGTSAAVPQKERFLSSLALQRENGEIFLFDCGEGAQYQMMKFNIKMQKITKIFFSHFHGDHYFGIFGLLHTMKQQGRTAPLAIYGPFGIKQLFTGIFSADENLGFNFPIDLFEITEEGFVCEGVDYRIFAKSVLHSVYTLAYAYIEKDRLGRFNKEKALAYKVPRGPKWRELQQGKAVLSSDNKVISPDMVLGKKRRGFKIVIGSDGLYDPEAFATFAAGADVLIMEATFSDEKTDLAREKLHSTARWSAKIAAKAEAKRLILTHISPRHKDDSLLTAQAREEFPEALVAYDGLEILLDRKELDREQM